MPKIYLAHKYEKQKEALVIQRELEAQGWTVLNPFVIGEEAEQKAYDQMKAQNGFIDDQTCREIVAKDLDAIDQADAVFAILSPNAIGTVMEIFYTAQEGKPVITLLDYKMPFRHPWIATTSSEVFEDAEKALFFASELRSRLSGYETVADPYPAHFQTGEGHAVTNRR